MKVETVKVQGLSNCPFCGRFNLDIMLKDFQTDYKPPYNAEVVCGCGASVKVPKFFESQKEAIQEAMDSWNRRYQQ